MRCRRQREADCGMIAFSPMQRIALAILGIMIAVSGVSAQDIGDASASGIIEGRIFDSRGGEALANVSVQLAASGESAISARAVSDSDGKFRLARVTPGNYTLTASTVGFHVVKREVSLAAKESKSIDIVLSPDKMGRTDTIDVKAGPFDAVRDDSPSALVLSGTDVTNLASVLADDPLRAVQSLPGVSSNNDFDARFSVRGADYDRVGLYLDDVLLHQPFHMLQSQTVTGSGSAFNGDMVEELELHEGAFPARFGDRTAAILDVHTRDGSHTAPTFRIEASMSNAGIVAEGPLGKKKRGSWLIGARFGYLQYLISRIATGGSTLAFGLQDGQGRFSYDFSPKNKITLYLLESYSNIDLTSSKTQGLNSLSKGAYNFTLANLGWRFAPSPEFVVNTHAAWMREKFNNYDPNPLPLEGGFYSEWVATTNASWIWSSHGRNPAPVTPGGAVGSAAVADASTGADGATPLDMGVTIRRPRDSGFADQYVSATSVRLLDRYNGSAVEAEGYLQQAWNAAHGMVHLTAGVHFDRGSLDQIATALPAASALVMVSRSTRVQLGWGEYAQHQDLSLLTSIAGSPHLLPIRSNHEIAAVEQRLGMRTRFRTEFYNRADRDIADRPQLYPRFIGGKVFVPPIVPLWANSVRGYSRGVETFLQRSSANGFTGWVSWAWGEARMRDGVTGARFPSDFDQRNAISVYGSYRLRPSVNLSVHSGYGSGFPIAGYYTLVGGAYYLGTARNSVRMPYYFRTDVRINKSWTHDRWKIALFGELVNITNRSNQLFDSMNGYNTKTGLTSISFDSMLPIIPSVGVLVER